MLRQMIREYTLEDIELAAHALVMAHDLEPLGSNYEWLRCAKEVALFSPDYREDLSYAR